MPKFDPKLTRTYIAARQHPTLGTLIKIGSSMNPRARARNMGARLIADPLPYSSEARLKDLLAGCEVWRASERPWPSRPIFMGHSEWFYATCDVIHKIQVHLDSLTPDPPDDLDWS